MGTTIEIQGPVTAARVLGALREQGLLADEASAPPPAEPEEDRLLAPAQVAAMFHCDPKTVTRWAKSGRITAFRTPGGHRRYYESEVRALIASTTTARARPAGEPAPGRPASYPVAGEPRDPAG